MCKITLPIKNEHREGPVILVSRTIEFVFPLSYAYLAGYLRQMGEDVRILFRPPDSSSSIHIVNEIMKLSPVLVGFGSLYPELKDIGNMIRMLDNAGRQFPVVIGGQMVSPIPEFAVKVTGADFGVIGEGEITLYNLVRTLREGKDPTSIKGLAIRQGDKVILTGPGEFIEDLSKLPSVPYDLFPQKEWLHIGRWYTEHSPQPHWRFRDRVINVHGGRGYPFACNFCYHHSKPRYRPIRLMMAEAAEALERFRGNMLYFSDDLVLTDPERARQLVNEIKLLKKPVSYTISTRFDILARIDDNLLSEMKNTGCRSMGIGIESGSDRILGIIGKNCTVEMIRHQLQRLGKVGIVPSVSIMVGQLGETKEDVEASIALVRASVRSNPNIQYAFTITTPFPGSKLYKIIFEKGYMRDLQEFYDRYFSATSKRGDWSQVVNLSAMSDEEVLRMYEKINQAYQEEQRRVTNPIVRRIESSQMIMSKINRKLNSRVLFKLRKHRVLSLVPWVYDGFY